MHSKWQKKKAADVLYQGTGAIRAGGIHRWRGRDVTLFRHTFSVVITTLLAGSRYAMTEWKKDGKKSGKGDGGVREDWGQSKRWSRDGQLKLEDRSALVLCVLWWPTTGHGWSRPGGPCSPFWPFRPRRPCPPLSPWNDMWQQRQCWHASGCTSVENS